MSPILRSPFPPPLSLLLLLPALLLLLLPGAWAQSANPFCARAFFWRQDGTRVPGNGDWSSRSPTSAFLRGPCVGVSGIGVAQTFQKRVLIIDRSAAENAYMRIPGRPQHLAYAQELVPGSGRQRALDILTNTFCSSGQHGPDGAFLSIGGDYSEDYAAPGQYSIRAFAACAGPQDAACGFRIADNLTHSRWYPTTALLGDGRVLVVGGSSRGVGLNSAATNVPYVEYFPKQPGEAFAMPFLERSLPYNLYPFVHLLPSGRAFIFAGSTWALWDTQANAEVPGARPELAAQDAQGRELRWGYPLAATSALFPLSPARRYQAEVMICGGGSLGAYRQTEQGETLTDPSYPASAECFRIVPEAAPAAWVREAPMRLPRVDSVAVLLPDGHMLIMGGTGTGYSALGRAAHNASLTPEMYDTNSRAWYEGTLATSKVPRTYHSSALLLHNGAVFVSGSNQHSNIVDGGEDFPTEFRTEYFLPPYLMAGRVAPAVVRAPATVTYGSQLSVAFKHARRATKVQLVLAQPGFSTHGANHGMRNVELPVTGLRANGGVYVATAAVPRNRNILPPTWYWLFVVVDGVPSRQGLHIFVQVN